MNVTVMLPSALRSAFEGRRRLELGVPASSDVGDVLETMFKLYPKLADHVATEREDSNFHFNVYWAQEESPDLARWPQLREGLTLYLCGSTAKRLAD